MQWGKIQAITFLPNFKSIWHFEDKLPQLHCRSEIQSVSFLGSRANFKMLWHFEILTWESMINPKMCNILNTADRRANHMKIL